MKNVEFLRKQYPVGTRITLKRMDDPYVHLPPGLQGTVAYVDDMGNIGMKWDDGCTLALVPGVDEFSSSDVVNKITTPQPIRTEKTQKNAVEIAR